MHWAYIFHCMSGARILPTSSFPTYNALVPGHKLHKLLPPRNVSSVDFRKKRVFNLPVVRTDRCRNSFIFHHSRTLCKS